MDQHAFRQLLHSGRSGAKDQVHQPRVLGGGSSRKLRAAAATAESSQSTEPQEQFKPRRVKKLNTGPYRDRAAERRTGAGGDFAEVEAVLETFERQHADEDKRELDEKRQYLGGDSQHSVLVKGLDFALLEQQKLKASTSGEVDDLLETAYQESATKTTTEVTRKRTREEIVAELKTKRLKGNDVSPPPQDDIKQSAKFKPLGFKPIGNSTSKDKKVKKKGKESERKSKILQKSKEDVEETPNSTKARAPKPDLSASSAHELPGALNSIETRPKEPKVDVDHGEDLDIFAGVDDYEGLSDDDDDDEGNQAVGGSTNSTKTPPADHLDIPPTVSSRGWFQDEPEPEPPKAPSPPPKKLETPIPPSGMEDEPELPARLAPLSSSVVPSITDILAADEALEAEEKRKARKEKRKAGGGSEKKSQSSESKLNRDYQKLQAYTSKKGKDL